MAAEAALLARIGAALARDIDGHGRARHVRAPMFWSRAAKKAAVSSV